MMNQAWITGIQALQLFGIGPCLLLFSVLLLALEKPMKAIAPLLFLLSLSAGFFTVLSPLLDWQYEGWQHNAMILIMEAFPACAFLLLIQFLYNRVPSPIHWLILLMPLMGSGALIYLAQIAGGEICLTNAQGNISCLSNQEIHALYMVITGGISMLLMMTEINKSRTQLLPLTLVGRQRDQYWLIISLVVLTVLLLVIALLQLMGNVQWIEAVWASTMTRLAFVFLMFASFFRIFGKQFVIDVEKVPTAQRLLSDKDNGIARKIEALLAEDKLYREMGLTRTQLAEKLGISESRLSNIINRYFGCNFNILVNQRRVTEAQRRLTEEPKTQITVIAFDVGFNSIATFNRVFKEVAGKSPSEWRGAIV
jgi:AraC-like DNA-binding protein